MTSAVVQRYAQALFEEITQFPSAFADADLIRSVLCDSPELERLLKSPVVARQKKSEILQSLFGEHIDSRTLRFLQILVERGRESLLGAILDQFQILSDEAQGITLVQVRVPSELDEDEQARLRGVLSQKFGRKIRLETIVDAKLMGGIVLKIGDTIYDGSVRHQLSLLRDRLQMQA